MRQSKFYKADGIILKRKNTGEADRILTVFTREYGKLRLLAKGVRRITSRRAPHLEIFSRTILFIHRGQSIESISETTPIGKFENLRRDMQCVSLAYFFCELVDALLAEKQEHHDVFELLASSLDKLNNMQGQAIYEVSKHFALELLWDLGFLPRSKELGGSDLQSFIESVAERHLSTPHFARTVASW